MKDASISILKEIENTREAEASYAVRFNLSAVAQAFVDLQQARHKADYDIGEPFKPLDAAANVAWCRLAFQSWGEVRNEPLAQGYLYSLLFKDRT